MCVNNLPKVATQWNSGMTRDSNWGRRVHIPSALTATPLSHSTYVLNFIQLDNAQKILLTDDRTASLGRLGRRGVDQENTDLMISIEPRHCRHHFVHHNDL